MSPGPELTKDMPGRHMATGRVDTVERRQSTYCAACATEALEDRPAAETVTPQIGCSFGGGVGFAGQWPLVAVRVADLLRAFNYHNGDLHVAYKAFYNRARPGRGSRCSCAADCVQSRADRAVTARHCDDPQPDCDGPHGGGALHRHRDPPCGWPVVCGETDPDEGRFPGGTVLRRLGHRTPWRSHAT